MTLRAALLSRVYRLGFPVARVLWFFTRPARQGATCVVRREDDVLLVRHTYGDRGLWELPGGLVKRREEPVEGARREALEEVGLDVREWTLLGSFEARHDNRRDMLFCFRGEVGGDMEVKIDEAEIEEARWFPRDELPERLGRRTARVLSLEEVKAAG